MKSHLPFIWAVLVCLGMCNTTLLAQDEPGLLDLLGKEQTTEHISNAFKSTRVINGHSMEMLGEGSLDFRILHRFGMINSGAYELFGLDRASMRLGLDYAITDNLIVGLGRSTAKKELDGFVKYRILWQSRGKRNIPVSLLWVSGIARNGLKDPDGDAQTAVTEARRLGYYHQLIIGRKFSERFTLQLSPTVVHRNFVSNTLDPNDLYAIGFGGRFKFARRVAFVWDYSYAINRFPGNIMYNPLSIGFDIETGGHVFQLHFSNATGMNERAFIADENANWLKGNFQFGFNLSRVFQLKSRKIE